MSTEAATDAKPAKKKGGLVKKLILPVALLAVGGGGVYGAMVAGLLGHKEEVKEDNKPKLVKKGEEDPYAPKKEGGKEGEGGAAEVEGDGGSEYRTSYYTFSEDFTSNLKNSEALVQVSLACSTRRDGRVLMWLKKHELAIRSRLLEVLADTPEEDVYSIEGKDRLQKRLTAAINKVLTDTEGFGGVDAVYFRSMIVQ
ncbi:flagellar basal body-associated protein FliL [Novosphingobium sp. TH158]|uniref:flagellar basal body-associated FliL family protein n=1 Tax=Novosphingobium sp. TH158 TaxID=2067455 RepID=UPI000C7D7458|nr:flagellar basal body-associated FliL family protein [Novosphingobium sp. TH158]PLK27632.1 flagellar basal body-associated protein FliL [Novosphingobium sp. TH158]